MNVKRPSIILFKNKIDVILDIRTVFIKLFDFDNEVTEPLGTDRYIPSKIHYTKLINYVKILR